jgi:hypothetical protein
LLAQSVVQDFHGKVRFVSENYGDSRLAKRFGVTFYPVIFVDDVLVATPRDFYNMDAKATGRYIPLKSAASHERFRADLSRMIELILAGKKEAARANASPGHERHEGTAAESRGLRHCVSGGLRILSRLSRFPQERLRPAGPRR